MTTRLARVMPAAVVEKFGQGKKEGGALATFISDNKAGGQSSSQPPQAKTQRMVREEATSSYMHRGDFSLRSMACFGLAVAVLVIANPAAALDDVVECSNCAECHNATRIRIPANITGASVSRHAFKDCTQLEYVEFPKNITSPGYHGYSLSLEDGAFEGCINLKSVDVRNVSVMDSAFAGCTRLERVVLSPEGIYSEDAFPSCYKFSLRTDAGVRMLDPTTYCLPCAGRSELTIPSNVTGIGTYAFMGCTSLVSVVIPQSVTSISYRAFYGCISLRSVTIPKSVNNIGSWAFAGCGNLVSVNMLGKPLVEDSTALPSCFGYGLYINESYAASQLSRGVPVGAVDCLPCSGDVVIPENVTEIRQSTFEGCTTMVSVVIPATVIEIGVSAFSGCSSLKSVVFPRIGPPDLPVGTEAFYGCSSLETIIVEENYPVHSLTMHDYDAARTFPSCYGYGLPTATGLRPSYCFPEGGTSNYSCYKLNVTTYCLPCTQNLVIPPNVTSVGEFAFVDCEVVESVVIPDSVTAIRQMAFFGNRNLRSVTAPAAYCQNSRGFDNTGCCPDAVCDWGGDYCDLPVEVHDCVVATTSTTSTATTTPTTAPEPTTARTTSTTASSAPYPTVNPRTTATPASTPASIPIVLVAVGCSVGVIMIGAVAYVYCRKKRPSANAKYSPLSLSDHDGFGPPASLGRAYVPTGLSAADAQIEAGSVPNPAFRGANDNQRIVRDPFTDI